jgi:TPR repeat protein
MSIHFLIPGSKDPAHPANSNNIVVESQDGSLEALPKAPHRIQISPESLALFNRKVGEKIEESITKQVSPAANIEGADFRQIAFDSLVDLVSEGSVASSTKDQMTGGDSDYFMGTVKDKQGNYKEAYEYFLRSANRGHVDARYTIALYYYNGDLGYFDYRKCYDILKDFVDVDHAAALYLLSQFYHQGLGGCPQDLEKAFVFAKRSAALGSVDGKVMLASCYHKGIGLKPDHEIAFQLFNELYEENHQSGVMFYCLAMYYLGSFGVEKKNAAKAFELFKKAADLNYTEACFPLGVMYFEGVDTQQDYKKAVINFQKAAAINHPHGHMYLAHCLYFGLGIPADKAKARAIMRLYPPTIYTDSYYHLGCFAKAEEEHHAAFIHFENALKANDQRAYGPLGVCYFLGQGTAVDYKKAFSFLRKVIFFTPESFRYESLCYSEGKGTALNYKDAAVALERSATMWPDAETHHALALLYIKIPSAALSSVDCEKIILHFSRFIELIQDQKDTRIPAAYHFLASYKRIQFRTFNQSIDILNDSVRLARTTIDRGFQNPLFQDPAFLKYYYAAFQSHLREELSASISERERNFVELSTADFVQVLRYDIYMQKSYFDHYIAHPEEDDDKHRYKHLLQIHTFLYEDLDREWGLLRRDQLRRLSKLNAKLASFLVGHVSKSFYSGDLEALKVTESATKEEIADSFMPIMPKKKAKAVAKPKGAQKKNAPKTVPAPLQNEAALKAIPKPANQNRPPAGLPEIKTVSLPKVNAAPVVTVESAEVKRVQKIFSIAQNFKAAQEAVVAYYSKDVSSSLRKSIEAVFDKQSLSQEKVIALMEHLADKEQGSCVKNANGGARLIVGELSVGCHAFHGPGDKNHLGFIAELRKLMVALYQKKQDAVA